MFKIDLTGPEVEPLTTNRVDCVLEVEKNYPMWDISRFDKNFFFDNGQMQINFNPETGLVDEYCVNGKKCFIKIQASCL